MVELVGSLLVVEDDYLQGLAITTFLARHGIAVDLARTLEEALQKLRDTRPEGVITDLGLSGGYGHVEGFEVVEAATRLPRRPVIVVLTGETAHRYRDEALARGADFFLEKPTPLVDLLPLLSRERRRQAGHGPDPR